MPPALWALLHPLVTPLLWIAVAASLWAGLQASWRWRHAPRRTAADLLLACAVLLLGWMVVEILARTYDRVRHGVPWTASTALPPDRYLGWRGRDSTVPVSSASRRLLIVGDSITQAMGVAPGQDYASRLAQHLRAETRVTAAGGWGTLQEWLSARSYLSFKPDVVLLQISSNDIINNSWELERRSRLNNNLNARPYLIGDRLVFSVPSKLGWLQPFLGLHSRALHYALGREQLVEARLALQGRLPTVENELARNGEGDPGLALARDLTIRILQAFRTDVAPAPLVAFPVDDSAPYVDALRHGCAAAEVPFLENVPSIVRAAATNGPVVQSDGAHWNEHGHEVASAALAKALEPYFLAKR